MATLERGQARAFLKKAQEYLASAQDNLDLERLTPAAGDAIHAGIRAKDAIVVSLTGSTAKSMDHAAAAKELGRALGQRPDAMHDPRSAGVGRRQGRCGVRHRPGSRGSRRPCSSGVPPPWLNQPPRSSGSVGNGRAGRHWPAQPVGSALLGSTRGPYLPGSHTYSSRRCPWQRRTSSAWRIAVMRSCLRKWPGSSRREVGCPPAR